MFIEQLVEVSAVFFTGLYVAVSPCLFPLLPLFLIRSLQSEDSRKKSLMVTSALVLGIVSSLVVFMLISNYIGLLLMNYYAYISAVLGLAIAFTGILTMSSRLREILRVGRLSMSDPGTPSTLAGVFSIGFGYSLLAAPCALPAVFSLSFVFATQTNALVLLLMYVGLAVGVAVPYLALALVTGEARMVMASRISSQARKIEILAGVLLVIVGVWLMLPWVESVLAD
ncbi:MAG: hypothetical protein HXY34_01290 [Candidatus Thorarchaeota archaeon]|nr:hypothetical protein [Candidatus Thorarchaeota archaeon]